MFESKMCSIRRSMRIDRKPRIGVLDTSFLLTVSLVVALVVGPVGAHAEPLADAPVAGSDGQVRERLELLAPNPATGDRFGNAIATDGDTAVIGAPGYDRSRGAIYVSTFSDGAWCQPSLIATGAAAGDEFGCAVDIDGGTIVVGAWGASAFRGEAYVIERQPDGSWGPRTFIARGDVGVVFGLKSSPTEGLGKAVAIEGDNVYMSAPWAEGVVGDFNTMNAGAIYGCTRTADGTWGASTRLFSGPDAATHMGMSIALQGDTLVCGNSADQIPAKNAGSIRVFEHVGATWVKTAQYNGVAHSQLGSSVDISGDTILFGGRFYGGGGRVFAVNRTGSTWTSPPVEVASGIGDDQIGYSIDLEGDRAVVGAMKADSDVLNVGGIKKLFRHNGEWTASTMVPMGDAADDAYGSAVAIGRGKALVGGPAANTAGGADTGAVRVFDGISNHAPVLTATAPVIGSAAAGTQAVPGEGVTVASVLGDSVSDADSDDVGMAVYAMKLRSGAWQYSLDGGATWTDMVSASTEGALLLGPTDKIRFQSYFNTGSTALSYHAWDGTAGTAGTHVAIEATGGESAFSTATDTAKLDVDLPWSDKVGRLWGRDRYATSVATARYASNDWTDVTDIVLVSGEDANASDPLAAAGLVWAYRGAPMIQTSPKRLPAALEPALHEIADGNDTVRLHVVGGTNAIPEARVAEIESVLASRGVDVSHDRISGANRYDTAAKIAAKMVELRGDAMSGDVLVAHGADRTRFFDALALSPIAATQGSPILLTAPAALSAEASAAIGALDPDRVIVAGGTAVVSQAAFDQIPAAAKVRWAGTNRFDTAIVISDHAIEERMLSSRTVSVCSARPDASSLPDALASTGVSSGDASPLILTQIADTPAASSAWLAARKADIRHVWLVGGSAVITYDQEGCIGNLVK